MLPFSMDCREVHDIILGQDLRDLGLERPELVDLVEVVDLEGLDRAVVVLVQDQQVEHPDLASLDQGGELLGHPAVEVALAGRELDDQVVHRAQLIHLGHPHDPSLSQPPSAAIFCCASASAALSAATWRPSASPTTFLIARVTAGSITSASSRL